MPRGEAFSVRSLALHDSRRRARHFVVALASVLVLSGVTPASTQAVDEVVFVDSLAGALPITKFSAFGAAGFQVSSTPLIGPRFTLRAPTEIVEVGAFVNNCRSFVDFVPQCPGTMPFVVEIRRSVNGVPDPSGALTRVAMSHDNDPLTIAFERANPRIVLPPGEYFALIGSQGADAGLLLMTASSPFDYTAGLITMGVLDTATGASRASNERGAVRIIGRVPSVDDLLLGVLGHLQGIVASGGPAADKAEDAVAKLRSAQQKLGRDDQGALGEMEGLAGDLEAAAKNGLFAPGFASTLADRVADAARLLALNGIDRAKLNGRNAGKIAEADASFAKGDKRKAAGRFKDAVASYKDALAKADGA